MKFFSQVFLILLLLPLAGCNYDDFGVTRAGNTNGNTSILSSWLTQLGATTKAFLGADHSQYEICLSTAVDSSGNVYCGGYTERALGESSGGGDDAFVMKLNSSGEIQWVRQLGNDTEASSVHVNDTSGHERCMGVAVDSAGNVYCAGRTSWAIGESSGGGADAFVMKLNSSGEVQWLRHLGNDTEASSAAVIDTAGAEGCNGVAVDSTGNVYCAGYTTGGLGETSGGSFDSFIMKLNSAGVVQWVSQIGDATELSSVEVNDTVGSDTCDSVAVDGSGNVYCGGYTDGALGEAIGGSMDAFVIKLDSVGGVTWLKQMGSATAAASPLVNDTTQDEQFNGVSVDGTGNVYCAGYTRGAFAETNGGGSDALIVKFDSAGGITWVSQIGSDTEATSAQVIDTAGWESCNSVALDNSGNIYCAGDTGSTFGEAVGSWTWDPMVMKLDSAGTVQWIKQLGAATYPSVNYFGGAAYGVAVDASGTVYFAGEIYGTASEPEGGGQNGDVFVAKIKSDGTLDL